MAIDGIFGAAIGVVLIAVGCGLSTSIRHQLWSTHYALAVLCLPLGALLSFLSMSVVAQCRGFVRAAFEQGQIPMELDFLIGHLGEGATSAGVTLVDVQCVALVLVVAHGATVILKHLVDLLRILKLARRIQVHVASKE